eukprot:1157334-Ditylum_brightwellii.AAC.1
MCDNVVVVNANIDNTSHTYNIAGFVEGVYWEDLPLQSDPLKEPEHPFQEWACTIPEEEHEHIPLK